MPRSFAVRRQDSYARALDIEIRPSLAKFFASAIASFERIVEPGRAVGDGIEMIHKGDSLSARERSPPCNPYSRAPYPRPERTTANRRTQGVRRWPGPLLIIPQGTICLARLALLSQARRKRIPCGSRSCGSPRANWRRWPVPASRMMRWPAHVGEGPSILRRRSG
jgi:hypothetical protein